MHVLKSPNLPGYHTFHPISTPLHACFHTWPAAILPKPKNTWLSKPLRGVCNALASPLPVLKKKRGEYFELKEIQVLHSQTEFNTILLDNTVLFPRVDWNPLTLKDAHYHVCVAVPCKGAWRHDKSAYKTASYKNNINKQQSLTVNSPNMLCYLFQKSVWNETGINSGRLSDLKCRPPDELYHCT